MKGRNQGGNKGKRKKQGNRGRDEGNKQRKT